MAALELFHEIADPRSAEVRRFVGDHELFDQLRLRNIHYPEVQADFMSRGGKTLPALWDGERLFEGAELVIAKLKALLDIGRA